MESDVEDAASHGHPSCKSKGGSVNSELFACRVESPPLGADIMLGLRRLVLLLLPLGACLPSDDRGSGTGRTSGGVVSESTPSRSAHSLGCHCGSSEVTCSEDNTDSLKVLLKALCTAVGNLSCVKSAAAPHRKAVICGALLREVVLGATSHGGI